MSKRHKHRDAKNTNSKELATSTVSWRERLSQTWVLALIGAILYWCSLPPMKLPWAAYLSAVCWVSIAAKDCAPTRTEYWRIWLAGCLMWLGLLQGIRLAFWPLYAGWIALSLYLAVYLPIFIGMTRSLNRTWYIPLPFAAATAWVGCELIRAYFVTGFAACMLAHSQVPWPWMLPVASYFGCYGVSFVVMFIGAEIYQWWDWASQRRNETSLSQSQRLFVSNVACTLLAGLVVVLSIWSLQSRDAWLSNQEPIKPLATILLIQDDMPTQFDGPPEGWVEGWKRYEQQTAYAARTYRTKPIDLVVWPESTFIGGPSEEFLRMPWIDWVESEGFPLDLEISKEEFAENMGRYKQESMANKALRISSYFRPLQPTLLLGADVMKVRPKKTSRYNAAVWFDPSRLDTSEYYAKQHLVLFGETFPFISELLSMVGLGVGGIDAGEKPKAWKLTTGATVSTSICFEDVLPHLIHSHVYELRSIGKSPDILVNITNDGWFRDSSILDHHLNNAILAAVENRRPMLVAANLGISAWIDGDGRVIRSLPRLKGGSILAEPIPDGRWGWWQSIGDWPARALAIVSCLPSLAWLASRGYRANQTISLSNWLSVASKRRRHR